MEALLIEIDDLLAKLENYVHGQDGEEITKMRAKIQEKLDFK